MSIFEKATKVKLRFVTPTATISVEDLWDLPLTGKRLSLDSIAIDLNKQLSDASNISFVTKKTNADEEVKLRFEIVKHIIDVKVKEQEARKAAADKAANRAKVLEVLAQKQDQKLNNMTEEELLALLAE